MTDDKTKTSDKIEEQVEIKNSKPATAGTAEVKAKADAVDEKKPAEVKAGDDKKETAAPAAENKAETSVKADAGDVKASEVKASDTKASEVKASDTKASEVKVSDAKASEAKVSDAKASEAKAEDKDKTPAKAEAAAPAKPAEGADKKEEADASKDKKEADAKPEAKADGDKAADGKAKIKIDPAEAHVLVVEDNVPNFVLIARMLAYMGVQRCEWKTSGWQVVEFADTLPRIDLILMDIRLPYEDGFQALEKLRSNPRLKETLVIAVTAEASVEQMNRAKESGFDGFLGKPLDPDRFPEQIKRVLNGEAVWEMH